MTGTKQKITSAYHPQSNGLRSYVNAKILLTKIPSLTHFSPMSHFYTPGKRQKTYGDIGLKWVKALEEFSLIQENIRR